MSPVPPPVLLRSIATLLVSVAIIGCSHRAPVAAPFRARPDSVASGHLEGPYSGQVVDATSGEPIPGAFVYATWTYVTGYGVVSPGAVLQHVVSTDPNGRYSLPSVHDIPRGDPPTSRGSARLGSFHLVIYKSGYVGYRSDRRFRDFGPRRDFAQRENRAELERWRADFSAQRHVRYLGGGSAIVALLDEQTKLAAAELSGKAPQRSDRIAAEFSPLISGGSGIVAAQLLSEKQIKDVTKYDGSFETGPLGDEPDTSAYSSQHFKALQRDQSHDVALRLWKLSPTGAEKRYQELGELLPKVEQTDEIADLSLRSVDGTINGVVFLDRERSVVVMLTCGKAQCDSADVVADVARIAYQNLKGLMPPRGQTRK